MDMTTHDIMTRLAKVERQNGQLRIAIAGTLTLVAALLLMAQSDTQVPEIMRARNFTLVTEHGEEVATFAATHQGAVLRLTKPGGTSKIELDTTTNSAAIRIATTGPSDQMHAVALVASGSNATVGMSGSTADGGLRSSWHMETTLFQAILLAENEPSGHKAVLKTQEGVTELRLGQDSKEGIRAISTSPGVSGLAVRDAAGRLRLWAGVQASSGPEISFFDQAGVLAARFSGPPPKVDEPAGQ